MTRQTFNFGHFLSFLAVVLTLLLYRCSLVNDCSKSIFRPATTAAGTASEYKNGTKPGMNSVSYLYIVGVEGVGHHGISPAIAHIAKACKRTVVYQFAALRRSHRFKNSKTLSFLVKKLRHLDTSNQLVQVIEDSSFPSGPNWRNSTALDKKRHNPYDLEWMFNNLVQNGISDIKFLYLTRDFYRTVASHPEFDGSYVEHAKVLHDFVQYLLSEYNTINSKKPNSGNLWRQISYEWFTEMRNCTELVTSVVQFTGWQDCDITRACAKLNHTIIPPKLKSINESDLALIKNLNASVNIPFLNYRYGSLNSY